MAGSLPNTRSRGPPPSVRRSPARSPVTSPSRRRSEAPADPWWTTGRGGLRRDTPIIHSSAPAGSPDSWSTVALEAASSPTANATIPTRCSAGRRCVARPLRPNAPVGSTAPGRSPGPGRCHGSRRRSRLPRPRSPAGRCEITSGVRAGGAGRESGVEAFHLAPYARRPEVDLRGTRWRSVEREPHQWFTSFQWSTCQR